MVKTKDPTTRVAVIGLKGLPAFGGAASVGENIIDQLKDQYEFTVYSTASHTMFKSGKYNGYKQYVIRKFPIKKLNIAFYYFFSAFHTLFHKYDFVHLHHSDLAVILPLIRIRHKTVVTSHGSAYKIRNINFKYSRLSTLSLILSEKLFLRFANEITCVSENLTNSLTKRHKRKIHYIPNGITILSKSDYIDSKLLQEKYILFAAGRIIPTKGCHVFLESLKSISYKGKIIIVGDIGQNSSYTDKLIRLSTNLNVEFTGLIKEKKILNKYIASCRLFVFPSSLEAMSMMLLEAASFEVPIISSDIIENKDIFTDKEVTFHRVDDPIDLADKITTVLGNVESANKKATLAKLKLQEDFNWTSIASKYDSIFQSIL